MSPTLATTHSSAAPARRWPRPLFVDTSVGVHLCAGAAGLAVPGAEWWSLGAVALNHGALTAAGLLPRCALLGPNLRRLPDPPAAAPAGHAAPMPPHLRDEGLRTVTLAEAVPRRSALPAPPLRRAQPRA